MIATCRITMLIEAGRLPGMNEQATAKLNHPGDSGYSHGTHVIGLENPNNFEADITSCIRLN
jgi:hypothetical protein